MDNQSRHAYLIIAHTQFGQLKKLLRMLDDGRNDIYVHIDSKAKDFRREDFDGIMSQAGVFFTERTSVIWGAYSQIHSELVLLRAAAQDTTAIITCFPGPIFPSRARMRSMHFLMPTRAGSSLILKSRFSGRKRKSCCSIITVFRNAMPGGAAGWIFSIRCPSVCRSCGA